MVIICNIWGIVVGISMRSQPQLRRPRRTLGKKRDPGNEVASSNANRGT